MNGKDSTDPAAAHPRRAGDSRRATLWSVSNAVAPARLDAERRLFVDLIDVERRDNVRRAFHQARKHGLPVISQEAPWERLGGMTASVIYDREEGVFKAWYMAGFYAPGKEHVQCLALSDDGVSWTRPVLGLHRALGNTDNNIVVPAEYHDGKDHFETMLKDPMDPDPARRYKAIGWSSYDWDGPMSGIYTGASPDGVRWTFTPEPIIHHHPRPGTADLGPIGDAQAMMIDTRRRRYVAMLRSGVDRPGWRLMAESRDFVTWTRPAPFLFQLNHEESLYNNNGFVYGAQYLGFLTHFDRRAEHQSQTLRLLTSRDGDVWMRAPAADPLVGLGEVGDWDRFQIMLTGGPPIPVGDRLHIYYRGTSRRHNKVAGEFEPRIDPDQERSTMSIGLATLRLDGFASIDASYDGGSITTAPFRLAGAELRVNAKCDYGRITAELLDQGYRPLPGYAAGDCVAAGADSTDQVIRWRGPAAGRPLSAIAAPARIRFHLTNARLYSYWLQ